ncbi:lytic murein transglycosylase B [Aquirhabdus parva]|uniref:Lytic murein transglycosylase B n=1 Tax=Aquirhabdus parva TaxID=2283318 RepID=A0A345P716_9GAMM|nr:lytic murein transglycosylase B [Aquirhabdus parva]AXI03075.1 lytic murein transglycosylase B [Aquirhabdus parva]
MVASVALSTSAYAGDFDSDPAYPAFRDQMVRQYQFAPEDVDNIMINAHLKPNILAVMAKPGESKEWYQYQPQFITEATINKGLAFQTTYIEALNRAESTYGVPAEIILGILGVETGFGGHKGSFQALDALSTLAFKDTRRPDYFKQELAELLVFARDEKIDVTTIKSSYAGAIGYPQFMPSNIRQYGVDFDGSGRIDLVNSPIDAIGSIANYLASHGWQKGKPIGYRAKYEGTDDNLIITKDLTQPRPASELFALGLTPITAPVAPTDLVCGVRLMGDTGPLYWFTYPNYQVITTYNRSRLYATAVWQLGAAIRARGAKLVMPDLDAAKTP